MIKEVQYKLDIKEIKTDKGVIKPIEKYEDFSTVIDVFKEPPFSEPLTEEDKREEFLGYVQRGIALGYYNHEGEIMGYAGIMNEVEDEHAPYFDKRVINLNNLYVFGLATLSKFRGHGVCTHLMEAITNYAIEENNIDFVYLRISAEGSMSEGLCRKQGYDDLYQDGSKVVQEVTALRGNGEIETDERSFLIKPTSTFGKAFLTLTGSVVPQIAQKNKVKVFDTRK